MNYKIVQRQSRKAKGWKSWSIVFDDKNLKKIKTSSLRKNIAIVSQDTLLFHGTVSENIAFGNLDCKQIDIENAAKEAEAHN